MAPRPACKLSQPSCKEHMTIFYIVLEWPERPHWEQRAQLPGIPALHLAASAVFRAVTFREIRSVVLRLLLGHHTSF